MFDVGGPLNLEIEHERLIDLDIRAAAAEHGITVADQRYANAVRFAVESYAWDAHTAIIWSLTAADAPVAERVFAAFAERAHRRQIPFELRPGMADLIAWLHGRGVRLGLAANQPHQTLDVLDAHGIGHFFHHRELSGTHGFRKPDLRLFTRACEDVGVSPAETIMVGDRIDNDICPARQLGMQTVLFRTGRHVAQQPRNHLEVPHAEVRSADELRTALEQLLSG